MKYWTVRLSEKMSFDKARELMDRFSYYYITRDEYDGFLFKNHFGELCILLRTGEVIVNPKEILNKDKEDWFNVTINQQALIQIVNQTKLDGLESFLHDGILISFDSNKLNKDRVIKYVNSIEKSSDCIGVYINESGEIDWY